ncbi:MAG TPA: hypothetical protein DCG57_06465 [Candidatus Riflebacteria bacterium]|nr:hypothetical protein [Candidatus Riflebacteria bacterium]
MSQKQLVPANMQGLPGNFSLSDTEFVRYATGISRNACIQNAKTAYPAVDIVQLCVFQEQ